MQVVKVGQLDTLQSLFQMYQCLGAVYGGFSKRVEAKSFMRNINFKRKYLYEHTTQKVNFGRSICGVHIKNAICFAFSLCLQTVLHVSPVVQSKIFIATMIVKCSNSHPSIVVTSSDEILHYGYLYLKVY